jgi:hypothetical protein
LRIVQDTCHEKATKRAPAAFDTFMQAVRPETGLSGNLPDFSTIQYLAQPASQDIHIERLLDKTHPFGELAVFGNDVGCIS